VGGSIELRRQSCGIGFIFLFTVGGVTGVVGSQCRQSDRLELQDTLLRCGPHYIHVTCSSVATRASLQASRRRRLVL